MSEVLFLVEQAPEGGYTARALGDSIFTEADTLPELRQRVPAILGDVAEAQKIGRDESLEQLFGRARAMPAKLQS